jgi:hypothetical protein
MDLFTALRRNLPSPDRDPREDFITEAWRWLLQHDPHVATAFLAHLGVPRPSSPARWSTQVRLADGACVVDLVGDVPGGPILVCEHKTWAQLRPAQMSDYAAAATNAWPGRTIVTVLVTARHHQHTQSADRRLTWSDIHALVRATPNGTTGVAGDFCTFLGVNQMEAHTPVTADALAAYSRSVDLRASMTRLFDAVRANIDERPDSAPIWRITGRGKGTVRPNTPDEHWGRLGFGLPSFGWRPGCFVGVLMNPANHRVSWSQPDRGPDLTVILSFHLDPGTPDRHAFLGAPEYHALQARLAAEGPGAGVDVYDIARDHGAPNEWHPLHLRRPLADVLHGAADASAQTAAVLTAIDALVDLLQRGGELTALLQRLRR